MNKKGIIKSAEKEKISITITSRTVPAIPRRECVKRKPSLTK